MTSEVFFALKLLKRWWLLHTCTILCITFLFNRFTLNLCNKLSQSLVICFHIHNLYLIVRKFLIHTLQIRLLTQIINLMIPCITIHTMLRPCLYRCNSRNNRLSLHQFISIGWYQVTLTTSLFNFHLWQ